MFLITVFIYLIYGSENTKIDRLALSLNCYICPSMNTFGQLFRLTTFGESHGVAIGGIIDGCPAGLSLDLNAIQQELDRRKPGQSTITTARKESDTVQILSGLFEGKTTGSPIGFTILNEDQNSKDYSNIKELYRPSHADFTYDSKYGFRDYRGGGRSSARETANWVVAGAIAKQLLSSVNVHAFVSSVGEEFVMKPYQELDFSKTENNLVRCPDEEVAPKMIAAIEQAKTDGDSLGGTITCVAQSVPAGWGEPVFDKLHARLGQAMLSINAVKGFEYGSGFCGARMKGSEHNDPFLPTPNPSEEGTRRRIISYNPKLKAFAKKLRENMTPGEVKLWAFIKGSAMGVDFDRQRPIDEFIVDFYCKDLMLAIEIDGRSHDHQYEADVARQHRLESLGVTFIRFEEVEVMQDIDNVILALEDAVAKGLAKGLVGRQESPLLGGDLGVGSVTTQTNLSGGIQGGISNGMDIYFRIAFKPTATIMQKQNTINQAGEAIQLEAKGRHDPCVVPRAVPIVEAMTAMVLADFYLLNKNAKV